MEELKLARETVLSNQLKELCHKMNETNKLKKEYEKQLEQDKKEFKKIIEELGVTEYQDESVKVSLTVVDKSYLAETPTLNYLKEKGLSEYIHTKEFFDYTELTMAATQNKIKLEDLSEFLEKKEESRINIYSKKTK